MKEIPNREEVNASPDLQYVAGVHEADKAKVVTGQENAEQSTVPVPSGEAQSDNCASMDLAIQSEALSVSLRSRASMNPETISLTAQVRLLTDQLAQITMKLDEANYKIGFLEGQLFSQREKFEELRMHFRGKPSTRLSIVAWLHERLPFNSKTS